ncbi:hypothetical protein M406DRAFT_343506 [Cryphonectria parasitica EP155]|uniref:Uncharacterized protein n=1 Tax=Cryphonectria parasitica (strain ATCC 38755 / EP155) TaxID=660469 RepID=A0A9P5CI86_CRYP1|nr:uncharacterized protein M406DRAFT_343506 [Cryphonectria parasitica EP155]KAF3760398.1 hypothetical protein M406DRAFT_343506 [Cryphonectria parasitica EP155]
MLDDTEGTRNYMVAQTMRFNDVLDAEKLHVSLSKLLEIGDWRKLGGRLRFKDDGRLEIHVPKQFTSERPALLFSHDASWSQISIDDHPLGRDLPRPTQEPSIQRGADDFRDFAARADMPMTIEEMIHRDLPQISLHVTSFQDATLVGLVWPHTLMDAFGIKALWQSWSLVLSGKDQEIPPVLGAHKDVLYEVAVGNEESHLVEQEESWFEKNRLKGRGLVMFVLRYVWAAVRDHGVEKRTIYLPRSTLVQLQDKAKVEAAEVVLSQGQKSGFISNGDVLMAWAARLVALAEARPKPVTIMAAVNARLRLASILEKPPGSQGVYMQNMVLACFASLVAGLSQGSLGPIALECRRHVAQQTTERQMIGLLRLFGKLRDNGKEAKMPYCGESDALLILWNDLTKVDLVNAADFSPAVLHQGAKEESRINPLGTMVYHHLQRLKPNKWMGNTFTVLGNDPEGGCWIMGILAPRVWTAFQKELSQM